MIREREEMIQIHQEYENTIVDLETQIKDAKKLVEYLTSQLQERKEFCQRQELDILSLNEENENCVVVLRIQLYEAKRIE